MEEIHTLGDMNGVRVLIIDTLFLIGLTYAILDIYMIAWLSITCLWIYGKDIWRDERKK